MTLPGVPVSIGFLAMGCAGRLEVFARQPRVFGDAGQHVRADLVVVVEGEDEVRPAWSAEDAVGSGLALEGSADAQQSGENELSAGARPLAHAAAKEMLRNSQGWTSPLALM